jgi:hypothetical protein
MQDGQDGKKWKENHLTKVTKIPKTKRQKYGMKKTIVSKWLRIMKKRHSIYKQLHEGIYFH